MLNQRRRLLAYLRRSNFERYCFVLHKLGLKDVYAKQVHAAAAACVAALSVLDGCLWEAVWHAGW